jgi:NADH dehydrogenase
MKVAVTGAFGYSGRYIAMRLLAAGHEVITLTNSPLRENPFGEKVRAFPFHFNEPVKLADVLRGADALINTYWVRFNHRLFTHDQAVTNTKTLFKAATQAGVRRIVHVSITNPDASSKLPYFKGKAELETALERSGISYCILRPTVLFGREDVLINNIAWTLRHLPVVGVFGRGDYKLQPIYVEDLASAASLKATEQHNEIINAIGPETFTYRQLVEMIRAKLGLRTPIVGVPPLAGYAGGRLLGLFVDAGPLGNTRLTDWVAEHKDSLGRHYTSELARRTDRVTAYRGN